MSTRRRCREVVLQILYEDDLNPERNLKNSEQFLVSRLKGNRPLIEFANGLLRGVREYRREIDKQLSDKATNWSLRRMAAIDRNVLRLASYEFSSVIRLVAWRSTKRLNWPNVLATSNPDNLSTVCWTACCTTNKLRIPSAPSDAPGAETVTF